MKKAESKLGTLTNSNLFVEFDKKISYAENPLESKVDILEELLPEYVGMKKVRTIISNFKKVEGLKPEVLVYGKNRKTYSICCDEDGEPYFVEAKTNIADIKTQILSIVSEYIDPEDLDEFIKEYLLAVAKNTVFGDEIELFTLEIRNLLELLQSDETLCLNKRQKVLIDKEIENCERITASYDCMEQIQAEFDKIIDLISKLAGKVVSEQKYHVFENFVHEISAAIDELTVTDEDYNILKDMVNLDIAGSIKRLNVVPDFIPDGFEYLDGNVLDNNYRIYAKNGIQELVDRTNRKLMILKWVSGRTLSDGTYVKGFYITYGIVTWNTWSIVSTDEIGDFIYYSKKLWWAINQVFDASYNLWGLKFITEEQYEAVSELNQELGKDVIKLKPAWIISRDKDEAYTHQKVIENNDGNFYIAESPKGSWNAERDGYNPEKDYGNYAFYLVID